MQKPKVAKTLLKIRIVSQLIRIGVIAIRKDLRERQLEATIEVMAVVLCAVFMRNKRDRTWGSSSAVLCENGANDYPKTNCPFSVFVRPHLALLTNSTSSYQIRF